jgi:hypothetical protein
VAFNITIEPLFIPSLSPRPPSVTVSVPEPVFGFGVIAYVVPLTSVFNDDVCIIIEPCGTRLFLGIEAIGLTVCISAAEVLPASFVSPEYCAVIV